MTMPVICFGQQPCGFFPRRFLHAKIMTARRLQQEIGGEIVFFYHDSDHDPRETMTVLRDRQSGEEVRINFGFRNKLQKKYTPLFAKELDSDWQKKTLRQLPCYVEQPLVNVFAEVRAVNVADFCLEMYARLGLLAGIRVALGQLLTFLSMCITRGSWYGRVGWRVVRVCMPGATAGSIFLAKRRQKHASARRATRV